METDAKDAQRRARVACVAAPGIRKEAGFTLIELMTVVAIVAILVAVALPSYNEAVRKGRRGQAKADVVELAQLAERHRTVQASYPPSTWNPIPNSPRTGTPDYNIAYQALSATTFRISATPVAGGAQAGDRCGVLSINQAGQKAHSTGNDDQCQFGSVGTAP